MCKNTWFSTSGKKLFLLDMCELIAKNPPKSESGRVKITADTVLSCEEGSNSSKKVEPSEVELRSHDAKTCFHMSQMSA